MIPAHLHGALSPLLVRAGEWPDARALSAVPAWTPLDAKDEAERRARARPVPPERELALERLLASVAQLVHPELRAGPLARHLFWTAGDQALYYRLRPGPARDDDDERAGGDASSGSGRALPERPLVGWASFAPTAGERAQAFCLYAHRRGTRAPADPTTLLAQLRDLLTPALGDELAAATPHPAPAVRGPGDHAAIFRLDPAGYGLAYSYVYAYTNGERVVAAVQPLVHRTL